MFGVVRVFKSMTHGDHMHFIIVFIEDIDDDINGTTELYDQPLKSAKRAAQARRLLQSADKMKESHFSCAWRRFGLLPPRRPQAGLNHLPLLEVLQCAAWRGWFNVIGEPRVHPLGYLAERRPQPTGLKAAVTGLTFGQQRLIIGLRLGQAIDQAGHIVFGSQIHVLSQNTQFAQNLLVEL
jgi:hypothetical protein